MNPKIISIVLSNTFTVDDLFHRISILRVYLESRLFGSTQEKQVALDAVLAREKVDDSTAQALHTWEEAFTRESITLETLQHVIGSIEEDVRGLPTLRVYSPISLESKAVERVGTWVRQHIDPNLMLELMVDPRAVGGCAFVWHDTFHDYSLRHFIQTQRGKLVAMLDRYGSMGTQQRRT